MTKKLFKIASISMTFGLFLFTQSIQSQTTEGVTPSNAEINQAPPQGKPGGGRVPEQTETLEQMKGYKIGEKAADFSLKNIDGKMVSLENYNKAKGFIIVFTCNECPYSKFYEKRLIALNNKYERKGYPVIAINPNSPENPKEGYEAMQKRNREIDFTFPYLVDEGQKVYPKFGALRTPHVFLLDKELTVKYIGAIDDNARSAEDVKVKYLENAIQSLENGTEISPNFTKAIGCTIKVATN